MPADDQHREFADFLARHVKSYDPITDDYARPPFAADIKEGKNDPIYNAHSYHTKVPPRIIIPYILHYTQPGDLVLDPFCGSGMTGVAAQMCAGPPSDILNSFPELKDRVGPRACILSDLSPAACHIAYNYNTPVNVAALRREFDRIKAAVKDEFDWLYGTEHFEPAVGLFNPANDAVARRLKNPPGNSSMRTLLGEEERTWELISKAEVEARLGYPVAELPRADCWDGLEVANVEEWVCIPATIQYSIWSDVYRCEGFVNLEEPTGRVSTRGKNAGRPILLKKRVARGCGEDIVLWHAAVDPATKTFSEQFKCPSCQQMWNKLLLRLKITVPVWVSYTFSSLSSSQHRAERKIAQIDQDRLEAIKRRGMHPSFPDLEIDCGRELMTMGPANRGMHHLADFYTPRNQWGLGLLWSCIAESPKTVQAGLRFAFTAVLDVASRRNRFPQQAVMSSTLYVPSIQIEMNVFSQIRRRIEKLVNAIENSFSPTQKKDALVHVNLGDARNLTDVPDVSVDYVFTDPPFGGNIYYADASILVEAWLGTLTDEARELVFNRQRRQDEHFKQLSDYAAGMTAVFKEMYRVLKAGRWCTIEFNNKDGAVFEVIKSAALGSGFRIANMLLLDKTQKSFKQVKGEKGEEDVVDKDVLFNLHKPPVVRAEVVDEYQDLERQAAEAVRQHLQTLPERIKAEPGKYNDEHRTTATINSMLMNALIPRGVSVERLNLPFIERVCGRYFRKVGQRWYLRGEAVGGNRGNHLFAEGIGVTDELTAIDWLRHELHSRPMLLGELKPMWMRATGLLPAELSQTLVLEDILTENFWRDADTNRWREPTPEERERMNDDRSLRVLHDAERFVNGTLRRETIDEERCQWVDVLFQACRAIEDNELEALPALRGFDKAQGYALIPRLFQSVLRDHVEPTSYMRSEKQARAASQRLQMQLQEEQATEARPKAEGKSGQGTLDFKKAT